MTRETTHAACVETLSRLMGAATGAFARIVSRRQGYGRVTPACQMQRQDGPPPTLALSTETIIHRRALRQGNRNPQAVAAYVHRHAILSKGR